MDLKKDWKKIGIYALVVTGALWLVNYLLGLVHISVSTLYASVNIPTPVSAVSGTIGNKVLGWIGGIIPISNLPFLWLVAIFISAFVILTVGGYIVDGLKLKGKPITRFMEIILLGSAVFYIVFVGLVMQKFDVIIGLLIHTLLVGVAVSLLIAGAEKLGMKIESI